jgi:two-component system LytT family response regulator
MNVIIIDDEPLARNLIKEFLEDQADITIVAECGDGFEGIKQIQQHQPDLIFLDIKMPKINGFEMLEVLDESPLVIFTTAYDEYAIKAFESNAVDYLLKPFSKDRFLMALKKCIAAEKTKHFLSNPEATTSIDHNPFSERIVIKQNGNILILQTDDILFIESYDDYVKIHTINQIYVKKKTMSFYEKHLNPMLFARIHRSYIVNIKSISELKSSGSDTVYVIMENGTKLSVSRSGYVNLKNVWNF